MVTGFQKNFTYTIKGGDSCTLIGFSTNTGTVNNGTCLYTIYKNDTSVASYQCNGSQYNQVDWNKTISVTAGDVIKLNVKGNSSDGYSYFTHKCYIISIT